MIFTDKRSTYILSRELTESSEAKSMYGIRHFPFNSINTILDIGANVGLYSIGFRFFQPKARIIAIEPCKKSFTILSENTKGFNIESYNLALGTGDILFESNIKTSVCKTFSNDFKTFKTNVTSRLSCQSLMLDDIIKKFDIDYAGLFLKIDCEGGESVLLNHKPSEIIIRGSLGMGIEVHDDRVEFIDWIKKSFKKTHDIHYTMGRRGLYVNIFKKVHSYKLF